MPIFELILIFTYEKDFVPFESFKLWSTYEYWAYALIYTLSYMYRCHYKNVTKNAEYLMYPPQPTTAMPRLEPELAMPSICTLPPLGAATIS